MDVPHLSGIAVSSTAPAYSIVAGLVVLIDAVGSDARWVVLAGVVPMFLLAATLRGLNARHPDCGTSFAWTSRFLGARWGHVTGWLSLSASVLVMASLAEIGSDSLFVVLGLGQARDSELAEGVLGLLLIGAFTAAAVLDISSTARLQLVVVAVEVGVVAAFACVSLTRTGLAAPAAGSGTNDWVAAGLAATFLYWGWDSAYSLNEEADAPRSSPAVAAVLANAVLVLFYVTVTWAAVAAAGTRNRDEDGPFLLADHLSGGGAVLLNAVIVVSVLACLQATVLPSARMMFSMARAGVLPGRLAAVHPRRGGPHRATVAFGLASMLVYGILLLVSRQLISDVVEATAVLVAGYYSLTCLAAAVLGSRRSPAPPRPLVTVAALVTGAFFAGLAIVALVRLDLPALVAVVAVLLGAAVTAIRRRPAPP